MRFAHAEDPPRRIYVTTLSQRPCSNLQIVADALKDAIVARGLTKAEALRLRDSLKAACAKLGWPVAAVSCALCCGRYVVLENGWAMVVLLALPLALTLAPGLSQAPLCLAPFDLSLSLSLSLCLSRPHASSLSGSRFPTVFLTLFARSCLFFLPLPLFVSLGVLSISRSWSPEHLLLSSQDRRRVELARNLGSNSLHLLSAAPGGGLLCRGTQSASEMSRRRCPRREIALHGAIAASSPGAAAA